jgi:hypothetical protein
MNGIQHIRYILILFVCGICRRLFEVVGYLVKVEFVMMCDDDRQTLHIPSVCKFIRVYVDTRDK